MALDPFDERVEQQEERSQTRRFRIASTIVFAGFMTANESLAWVGLALLVLNSVVDAIYEWQKGVW